MGIPLKKLFETVGTWRGFFEPSTATVEIKRERVLKGDLHAAAVVKK